MRAFVINLKGSDDRWAHMVREFDRTDLPMQRVAAVDGQALHLPLSSYAEHLYRWFHGRATNLREIGCYLSHLDAWTAFLAGPGSHALICEDDLKLSVALEPVLEAALRHTQDWDILRLSGLRPKASLSLRALSTGHRLCVTFGRLKGTGAYVLSRRAAERLLAALLPMRLPFDHALDREWFFGLRAAVVLPFPVSQTETHFRSSIQSGPARRLRLNRRLLTTYPYQALNELARYAARTLQYLLARDWSHPVLPGAHLAMPGREQSAD